MDYPQLGLSSIVGCKGKKGLGSCFFKIRCNLTEMKKGCGMEDAAAFFNQRTAKSSLFDNGQFKCPCGVLCFDIDEVKPCIQAICFDFVGGIALGEVN